MYVGLLSYYSRRTVKSIFPDWTVRSLHRFRARYTSAVRQRAAQRNQARYGTLTLPRLQQELAALGLQTGGSLLVQSRVNDMPNLEGTPLDLLEMLLDCVGFSGTLLMPAHPYYAPRSPRCFDVKRTPASTGILPEIFRRDPDVRRSLHPTHSVCARGNDADDLVCDHLLEPQSCGPHSPYAKLERCEGQMVGLGLPVGYTTLFHVVEDEDLDAFPHRMYTGTTKYSVLDGEGKTFACDVPQRDEKVMAKIDLARIVRHLSTNAIRSRLICGIPVFLIECRQFLQEIRSLRDQNITVYGPA